MKTESWNIEAKSAAQAAKVLKAICPETPAVAIILGSGVNVLMDLHQPKAVPFEEVFGIAPSVAGHSGSVTVGRLTGDGGSPLVAVFRGRFHLFEGHTWATVTLPTQAIIEWGVPKLFLTNAAGGLNRNFQVGDLMVLSAYFDFLNPKHRESGLQAAVLAGPSQCLNDLGKSILKAGADLHAQDASWRELQKGSYAALIGPSYETMAEIEMLRRLGADAVGMSTVPELLTAQNTATEAAAVSVITNVWKEGEAIGGHLEVLEASKQASLRLDKLLKAIISKLPAK